MLRRDVEMYEQYPWGYRCAWYDTLRNRGVCYPLGIHWLVILARRIWLWTYRWPRRDWLEARERDIAAKAYCEANKRFQRDRARIEELEKENAHLRAMIHLLGLEATDETA